MQVALPDGDISNEEAVRFCAANEEVVKHFDAIAAAWRANALDLAAAVKGTDAPDEQRR